MLAEKIVWDCISLAHIYLMHRTTTKCSYNIKAAFTTKVLRNDDGKLIIVLYGSHTCAKMMK